MTASSKLLLFLFTAILPAQGAETVQLQTSPVISQRELKELKIESKRIGGELSIELWRCQDVTISHCDLAGIYLTECERVTITNCYIHDTVRNGVEIMRSKEVRVQGCRIENVSSAVYAQESQNLQITGCFARNVNGPFPRGQMVQFNNVTGRGNVISGNYAINDHGKSNPEDVISLFQSHGTAESPILIEDNYMTGDATLGSADKSKSGSGIMLRRLRRLLPEPAAATSSSPPDRSGSESPVAIRSWWRTISSWATNPMSPTPVSTLGIRAITPAAR